MIIPIRCFTCGKLVADKWEEFKQRLREGDDAGAILDSMRLKRICCRRMLVSHVDLFEEFMKFS